MSAALPLIVNPDERLRQNSRPLTTAEISDVVFAKLCDDLISTMHADDGIGLAAPQVGHSIRLIAVGASAFSDQDDIPFDTKSDVILINPEITTYSWKTNIDEEGCLSVPGYAGFVERHTSITVRAQTRDGRSVTFATTGYCARVLQHEIDHLNGILYIDRAKKVWKLAHSQPRTHI